MSLLSFPDVNVWLALAAAEHIHAGAARRWWEEETGLIAFCRTTQMGFLRLMTTAAAMDGKPLTTAEAWSVHDRLFEDDRVLFVTEPAGIESAFREGTAGQTASPKSWGERVALPCAWDHSAFKK